MIGLVPSSACRLYVGGWSARVFCAEPHSQPHCIRVESLDGLDEPSSESSRDSYLHEFAMSSYLGDDDLRVVLRLKSE